MLFIGHELKISMEIALDRWSNLFCFMQEPALQVFLAAIAAGKLKSTRSGG